MATRTPPAKAPTKTQLLGKAKSAHDIQIQAIYEVGAAIVAQLVDIKNYTRKLADMPQNRP